MAGTIRPCDIAHGRTLQYYAALKIHAMGGRHKFRPLLKDRPDPWRDGTDALPKGHDTFMLDTGIPEIRTALDVVRQGARTAQNVLTGMAARDITKNDFSPVTVADFASQALAARTLQQTFPDIPLVGEESSEALRAHSGAEVLELVTDYVGQAVPGASSDAVCEWIDLGTADANSRFWTLDPIDGTKGYLRGGQYAVALALVEEGKVILGALHCPNLDGDAKPATGQGITVIAARGQGTWLSTDGIDFTPLRVSTCTNIAQARVMRSVEDSHTNGAQIDAINARLGISAEPVRMDSQAKYAVLAAGGGEMLYRLLNPGREDYKECIWDQAAGAIILEEAGGRITDLRGHTLDFSTGRKLVANTGVLASHGPFHDATLTAIAEVCALP